MAQVTVEVAGQRHSAILGVRMGVVIIGSPLGRASAPLSTLVPEETARALLHRLVAIKANCALSPRPYAQRRHHKHDEDVVGGASWSS